MKSIASETVKLCVRHAGCLRRADADVHGWSMSDGRQRDDRGGAVWAAFAAVGGRPGYRAEPLRELRCRPLFLRRRVLVDNHDKVGAHSQRTGLAAARQRGASKQYAQVSGSKYVSRDDLGGLFGSKLPGFTCPHYVFECVAWFGYALVGQTTPQ